MTEKEISAKKVTYTVTLPTGKHHEIPMLRVTIAGTPSIGDISRLMAEIRNLTSSINENYIALTDLTKLKVNDFFRRIILYGMEKTYKSFLSVKNQAKISFVILGATQERNEAVVSTLTRINDEISGLDYQYSYFFLSDEKKVAQIVLKYFFTSKQKD